MKSQHSTTSVEAERPDPTQGHDVPAVHGTSLPVVIDETAEEVAWYERAQQNLIAYLQKTEEGVSILRRRDELMTTAYFIALARTRPTDWVLTRHADGTETAMIISSGAQQVAPIYGVNLSNIRPTKENGEFEPLRIENKNGSYSLRAWADVRVGLTGVMLPGVEATRRSDEDFTGRSTDSEGNIAARGDHGVDGDLRSAVWTLLFSKAVRVGCGMSRVPVEDLKRAWSGDKWKSVEKCTKGHGYGSSKERTATAVADEGVEKTRKVLGDAMLQVCGGDRESASALLKRVTSSPATKTRKGFPGFDTLGRLTKQWQVDAAWDNLVEEFPSLDEMREAQRRNKGHDESE